MGQRKKPAEMHPLKGAVARRMGLFSNFADANLCGSVDRTAPRMVEMNSPQGDYAVA